MSNYRGKLLLVMLVFVFFLGGCFRPNVLERLSISIGLGYDKAGGDKIRATSVLLGSADPSAKGRAQTVSVEGETSKGIRKRLNQEVPHKIVSGQIRFVTYESELARQGIISIADTFSRDPAYGDMMYLSISKGTAEDLLSHNYPDIPNIGTYLTRTINHNIENSWLPSCTVHDFRNDFYSVGKDPVLPIIERKGHEVSIEALALFRGDIMIGQINPREAAYLKLLLKRQQPDSFQVVMEKDGMAKYVKHVDKPFQTIKTAISNIGSKSSIKLISAKDLRFKVHVQMDAELQEISEVYDFTEKGAIPQLQMEISKHMSKELSGVLDRLKRIRSDSVGFGEVYRSSVRNSKLTKERWAEMFPRAEFEASVSVNLIRTGTIE